MLNGDSTLATTNSFVYYPDTLCWEREMPYSYLEWFTPLYFNHPAYNNYPVVGVSWELANAYCIWRTDRLNEAILIGNGIDPGEEYFYTDAWLAGNYDDRMENQPYPNKKVNISDGLLYPRFRLPTEMEWEYDALSQKPEVKDGNAISPNNIFPWKTDGLFDKKGMYQANFGPIYDQNGYMVKYHLENIPIKGKQNAEGIFTAPVKKFAPNDFGLFDMAGNVAEWVADVARINHDNSFTHRNYTFGFDENQERIGNEDSIHRLYTILPDDNIQGVIQKLLKKQEIFPEYDRAYDTTNVSHLMRLEEDAITGIHNAKVLAKQSSSRVVKGGSWATGPAYMQCGAREAVNEKMSSSRIGFRVAMTRVGSLVSAE